MNVCATTASDVAMLAANPEVSSLASCASALPAATPAVGRRSAHHGLMPAGRDQDVLGRHLAGGGHDH